ncbi:MAG: hypothetical protein CLLPBCKN_004102 [Chroococcidiopsis cubana SAG 39.79]|nr:hypothetical protein [Chroococcidiopsis cubana SAG 39.79]
MNHQLPTTNYQTTNYQIKYETRCQNKKRTENWMDLTLPALIVMLVVYVPIHFTSVLLSVFYSNLGN